MNPHSATIDAAIDESWKKHLKRNESFVYRHGSAFVLGGLFLIAVGWSIWIEAGTTLHLSTPTGHRHLYIGYALMIWGVCVALYPATKLGKTVVNTGIKFGLIIGLLYGALYLVGGIFFT